MDFSSTSSAVRSLKRRTTTSDALKALADNLEGPFARERYDFCVCAVLLTDCILSCLSCGQESPPVQYSIVSYDDRRPLWCASCCAACFGHDVPIVRCVMSHCMLAFILNLVSPENGKVATSDDVEQDVLQLLGSDEWEGVAVGFLLAKVYNC